MTRITMQDIANALGISRVTVWKAFNNQPGVSLSLRENILKKAAEMGYAKPIESTPADHTDKTVSLIVSRPDSSTFWTNIIHRMAQELSCCYRINLLYTYVPSVYTDGFTLPEILTNGTVQGAVILNVYDEKLVSLINSMSLPQVFLDTVPQISARSLTGDLFLLEGQETMYQITSSVISRGFKRIGFIGDIHYARTNADRYEGFCRCMKDHGLTPDPSLCLTHSIPIFSYHQELSRFLSSLQKLPDAFVCVSDYVAHFLQLYFAEHRDLIPGGILITGYDGSSEYSNVQNLLTTANVKTGLLGKRLSTQIVYRMEHPDAPYELTYINPQIIYRDSKLF